jgi:ATP-dependent Clp protease ATP-binding subunit ClpA
MRRVIQKAVENTVAKEMLSGNVKPGSVIHISEEQVASILGAKEQADAIAESTD